jgi:hypothetical protein
MAVGSMRKRNGEERHPHALGLYKAQFLGLGYRLTPSMDAEFIVDARGIDLDGIDGEEEFVRDLAVGKARRHQAKHRKLSLCEGFDQRSVFQGADWLGRRYFTLDRCGKSR